MRNHLLLFHFTQLQDATKLFNKYHAWVNISFMLRTCYVGPLDSSKDTYDTQKKQQGDEDYTEEDSAENDSAEDDSAEDSSAEDDFAEEHQVGAFESSEYIP